jgi:hypothetical protein
LRSGASIAPCATNIRSGIASSKELFEEVLKADADCGIAYWGIALSLLNNPHAPPPVGNLPLGLTAIEKAKGDRREDPTRARFHQCDGRVLPLRQGDSCSFDHLVGAQQD